MTINWKKYPQYQKGWDDYYTYGKKVNADFEWEPEYKPYKAGFEDARLAAVYAEAEEKANERDKVYNDLHDRLTNHDNDGVVKVDNLVDILLEMGYKA
jgi:hypothetical protein